jgi:hypothetical protein
MCLLLFVVSSGSWFVRVGRRLRPRVGTGSRGLSGASASGVGAVPRVNTGSGRPAPRRPTSRLDVPRKLDLPPRLAGLMRELRRVRAAGRAATACRDGKSVIARRVDTGSGRPTPRAGGSSPAGCRGSPGCGRVESRPPASRRTSSAAEGSWAVVRDRPRGAGRLKAGWCMWTDEVDLCARLSQIDPVSLAEPCTRWSGEVDLCARLSQPDPESTAERCTKRGRGAWNCPRPGILRRLPIRGALTA